MFTGIVEKTGKIKKIENKKGKVYFTISIKNFLRGTKRGDSISCDGVCLTVIKKTKESFMVELMPETLRLTKFKEASAGDAVNLELAVRVGDRIGGHFVSGHADAVGKVKKIIRDGKYKCLEVKVPKKISRYLAYKGSAAVNGVSLTIADSGRD